MEFEFKNRKKTFANAVKSAKADLACARLQMNRELLMTITANPGITREGIREMYGEEGINQLKVIQRMGLVKQGYFKVTE